MKQILIIYTSTGLGHKKIAENIGASLKEDSNNRIELLDLYDVASGNLIKYGEKLYYVLLKCAPWIWEFFYTNKVFIKTTLPLRTIVAGFKASTLEQVLKSKHYDIVISTQTNPSAIISYLKKKGIYTGKFVIAFSDYHLHRYWLYDNADLYLANIIEQKEEMVSRGIDPEKIIVCGITLQKQESEVDKQKVRNNLGLKENDKIVIVFAGSRGFGMNSDIIDQIVKTNAMILVVCGTSVETKERLTHKYIQTPNVKVLGYSNFRELISIADIVVSKPGGLTVAESLEQNVPILVSHFLPGQERLNIDYLKERNLIMPLSVNYYDAVKDEIQTGSFKSSLKNNQYLKSIVQHGQPVCEAILKL
ncbi:MAG: monogalactosyldiacylglycerol synthase [Candidatus Doudnabacteria bacterium Gr01-1014_77]|uniref:Monogalactosyldiacylglycerol synthase n=1 Tax=Candidatus Doudnabacteria bacterium Gr01-1014_77 TaxID=2017133 RepID=A0A554JAB9_9BACT|nr:MAG: monogalactosyldiacylglycerol synthase [Candidatus Doudnabacteria bacterium Gr01-1014_77]